MQNSIGRIISNLNTFQHISPLEYTFQQTFTSRALQIEILHIITIFTADFYNWNSSTFNTKSFSSQTANIRRISSDTTHLQHRRCISECKRSGEKIKIERISLAEKKERLGPSFLVIIARDLALFEDSLSREPLLGPESCRKRPALSVMVIEERRLAFSICYN